MIERCATDIVAIAEARHVGLRNGTLPPNADELVVSTEVTCGTDLDAFIVRGSLFEHERAALERWIATENKLANTAWYVERRYGNEPQRADNTVSDLVWGDYRRALEDHTDAVRSWQRWYARR